MSKNLLTIEAFCSVSGCEKPAKTKGMCGAHYQRQWRHGDPLLGGSAHGKADRYFNEVVRLYQGAECLIWPYRKTPSGYGVMQRDGRPQHVSRLACIEVYGEPPTLAHQAAHSCGKGHLGCVNPKHLRWATPAENNADRAIHGTVPKGKKHWNGRLSNEQVAEIRALAGSMPAAVIGARYGITREYVYQIKRSVRRYEP